MIVIKRNGTHDEFNREKIKNAVTKAMREVDSVDLELVDEVCNVVESKALTAQEEITVEQIQDIIEDVLIEYGNIQTAKAYIRYRHERSLKRKSQWQMDDLQKDILYKKYVFENEGFDGFISRVGYKNPKIQKLIREKKFIPAGRILAGRRLFEHGKKVTYSNCFVITPPEDNIESIFETAKSMARTYSYGGGCGTSIGNLRPRNSKVNNSAKETTGAVSFMDLYSMTTGLIGQQGRRGALMISMPVEHPDIVEFVNIKTDLSKVTFANISIMISDDFMRAVKNDEVWKMTFTVKDTGEVIERHTNARDLFMLISKNNTDYAEPGMLFWDRVKEYHLNSENPNFEYASTNPCFTGDMKLLTEDGYKTFEELSGKEVRVVNINGEVSNGRVWSNGVKDTIKLKLSDGNEITCTPDHKFLTTDGFEVEAKDLKGERIQVFYKDNEPNLEMLMLGFIQGDGGLSRLKSKEHLGMEVNLGKKDGDVRKLFEPYAKSKPNDRKLYVVGFNDKLRGLGFSDETLPTREFPKTYDSWSLHDKGSFLNGCYSANGSVIKGARIAYKTTSKKFAEKLMETLNVDFGIDAYITVNKKKKVTFYNGEYECKESYDINIHRFQSVLKFSEHIGFYHEYKRQSLIELIGVKCPKVISVRENGTHEVFDFSEPKTHWGVVENLIAHNCGEKPLPSGGSCLLGSMNVDAYVQNGTFDMLEFQKDVDTCIAYLDDVLEEGVPLLPLAEQRESVSNYRQIGLGIMGLADAFIHMEYKYGDEESLTLSESIAKVMINQALQTSALRAKEFGTYPLYDRESVLKSKFLKEVATEETYRLVSMYGLRNAELLSIAPTGSISTMIGVSGGIEPIFSISYTRESKSLGDNGSTFYKVFTAIAKEYMDEHGLTKEEELPDFFVTSGSLDYRKRVEMQSVWQKYIDAGISSTVNLPKGTTPETVADLYLYAWEKGLKGITVFVDGCKRLGILTTDESNGDDKPESEVKETEFKVNLNYEHDKLSQCPECGEPIEVITNGCAICMNCGASPC